MKKSILKGLPIVLPTRLPPVEVKPGEPLLTHAEAAERLSTSQRTVSRLVNKGLLGCIRIPHVGRRIPASAIDELIAKSR